ncbi:MAG: fluoride efflux transporter CrcB [Gammaproteobacteria bacterium]|nr:fluoride efflux transporter CrcB [Gammaproteobacteria bacterium]MBK9427466.1 fluoride efflux transporter CrcB [Gammaproteobacteria bacterium]
MQWLAVAAGGVLGALARYGVNVLLAPTSAGRFPFATLTVNVLGCILIGVFYVLIVERAQLAPLWREFLMIGILGAFTTFSAFALDSIGLWQNGQPLLAALNVGANLVLCLGGTATAIAVTRLF